MRVMILVKATAASEAGVMPGTGLLAAMSRCNEELARRDAASAVSSLDGTDAMAR